MNKMLTLVCILALFSVVAAAEEPKAVSTDNKTSELDPCVGKYCISIFTKTRTAKVVPEGKWLLSLKYDDFRADEKWNKSTQGSHHSVPGGEWKDIQKHVYCAKYGWTENHQIAIGIPFVGNNFNFGTTRNKSQGISNIFIFEKWKVIKETNDLPAVSVDFWYFLPTGDPGRMLGTDDDAYKITTSVSKAWKDFSLHFNPGYTWNKAEGDNNISEVNAAVLFTADKKLWPAIEYNYYYTQGKGHAHDIVPGLIWKYRKGGSIKAGVRINLDSTYTFRDRVGLVLKISQYF